MEAVSAEAEPEPAPACRWRRPSPPGSSRPARGRDDGRKTGREAGDSRRDQKLADQIERQLLAEFVPPSVIVNDRGDIVYVHGRTGMYIELQPGQPRYNLLAMAREGLHAALASTLHQVSGHSRSGGSLPGEGQDQRRLHLHNVIAAPHPGAGVAARAAPGLLRAGRARRPPATKTAGKGPAGIPRKDAEAPEPKMEYDDLERELQSTKESLAANHRRTRDGQRRAQVDATRSSSPTNEELQSANEELETSKEEMQSLNEELQTVNAELQDKVEDLSQANDDMQNLLNSTEIATIFLDTDLNINRFTGEAKKSSS